MNGTTAVPAERDIPFPLARPRPRLGFLGVGWIGRHRMEAIAASGAAEIAAIADPCREMAEQAGLAAPGAVLAGGLDELLSHDLDGVVIATPSAFHTEQAVRALERGLAVFCQKPLARTLKETARVVEAARLNDRLLSVDFSYRYTAGMQKIRELVGSGELGTVYAADFVFHNAYGPDKDWFYDPRLSGGGCVMDLGIHLVDLALWVFGFPGVRSCLSRLYAAGKQVEAAEAVEDYAVSSIELQNGATVRIACSWKLPAGCDAVIEASFYGTGGGASFRNVNGSFYDFTAERFHGTSRHPLTLPPDNWGGRAAIDWARRLVDNPRFDPATVRLLDVAATLDMIYGR